MPVPVPERSASANRIEHCVHEALMLVHDVHVVARSLGYCPTAHGRFAFLVHSLDPAL